MHEKGFKTFLSLFWPRGITRTYNTKALIVVWFGAKIYNKHFRFWNVLSIKCPVYEMSCLWNVLSMKCPILWNVLEMHCLPMISLWNVLNTKYLWNVLFYEMSCLWNFLSMKCPGKALSFHDMSYPMKCPVYEMSLNEMSQHHIYFIPFSSLLLLISTIILYE